MRDKLYRIIPVTLTLAGLAVSIDYFFHLGPFSRAPEFTYLYVILAIFGSLAFLFYPTKGSLAKRNIPWYDWVLFLFFFGTVSYFSYSGRIVVDEYWALGAPWYCTAFAIVLWAMLILSVKRTSGLALAISALFFSFYPLLAPMLPGILQGPPMWSFLDLANYHMFSGTVVMGIPLRTVSTLVIGYIIFGVAIQYAGGGKFFNDLALYMCGRMRGGLAKVAVLSSAIFGSLSGSPVSNVVTVGSITIPAMMKAGYEPHYAAAIEACSSTGAVLMPPVMGTTAFIMAAVIGVPYYQVCIAAAIPAVLFYVGIFVQLDAYAARKSLKGLDRSEIPPLTRTLKEGWGYIFALLVLMVFLFYFREVARAPFYSAAFLFVFAALRKETRFTLKTLERFVLDTGKFLAQLTIILAGVGYVMGAFVMTGVGASFAHGFVQLAGNKWLLILIFGAVTSFILGMGMTVTACYIFVALTVAPVLVEMGFNLIAVHLFVLYYGMLSYITPPVAIASITAAPLANAPPTKVGITATRLAAVIYIIPFFFVISPALVAQATAVDIVLRFVTAVLGVILIGGGLEGYTFGIGKIKRPVAFLFILSGALILYPAWYVNLVGVGIAAIIHASTLLWRKGITISPRRT